MVKYLSPKAFGIMLVLYYLAIYRAATFVEEEQYWLAAGLLVVSTALLVLIYHPRARTWALTPTRRGKTDGSGD